jgi:hypothetical protein
VAAIAILVRAASTAKLLALIVVGEALAAGIATPARMLSGAPGIARAVALVAFTGGGGSKRRGERHS